MGDRNALFDPLSDYAGSPLRYVEPALGYGADPRQLDLYPSCDDESPTSGLRDGEPCTVWPGQPAVAISNLTNECVVGISDHRYVEKVGKERRLTVCGTLSQPSGIVEVNGHSVRVKGGLWTVGLPVAERGPFVIAARAGGNAHVIRVHLADLPLVREKVPNMVDDLKTQIAAGRIMFDSGQNWQKGMDAELLGTNPGKVKVTSRLQALALAVSRLHPIRIGSVITRRQERKDSLHKAGRAFDIGNEEIARTLLPVLVDSVEALKIDEIIYDAGGKDDKERNRWNFEGGKPYQYEDPKLGEHRNHIHLAVVE